jgi:hypothetical protein
MNEINIQKLQYFVDKYKGIAGNKCIYFDVDEIYLVDLNMLCALLEDVNFKDKKSELIIKFISNNEYSNQCIKLQW